MPMKSLAISTLMAAALLAAGTDVARADLSVTWRAVQSEFVLFGQKQESPFARLRFAMQVRGSRMRTEMTDHFGAQRWFVADRATGKALGIDPATSTWWNDPSTWSCTDIPTQIARSAAGLLATGGIEELTFGLPENVKLNGADARRVRAQFKGRVLGAPQPVEAVLILYFPADEAATFGADALRELYCGPRPAADAWQKAFTQYLKLPQDRAGALARVVGLPVQIELSTDLGMGQASVTLAAEEIGHDALGDEVFAVPSGFTERK
jgi:hypothetical protein